MTRKSKQPGGHNPLTAHELSRLKGTYGTATARLGTASQRRFGDCCLGLEPAKDPVTTPSGHIYSREAIVSYLLAKTQELKDLQAKRDADLAEEERSKAEEEKDKKQKAVAEFARKDQGAARSTTDRHAQAFSSNLGKKISTESTEEGKKILKRTSYWLSECQPELGNSKVAAAPIPDRPPSPMSGEPLRRKDLIPLTLNRDEGENGRVTCAVSGKAITTQPVVAIKKTGQVMLREVYATLAKPTMTCPLTGKKFKEKDVIELKKGSSGFAASGEVLAKRYRPTMT